jgi:carbamoyl-phosphate synthase large subunit
MIKRNRIRKKRTVLVTGIGGNVGQGILRNIRKLGLPIRLIGTNTEPVSSGNHLCDRVYAVPWGYDPGYADAVRRIALKENVDLIIPSTDYESYHLALARRTLPRVASSSARVNRICLDKWETSRVFLRASIPFAETFLPSGYGGQFAEIVVKPREGRGSRGLVMDPARVDTFPDTYVVQRRYQGKELTTGFYVTRKGDLHGQITFERVLYSGLTGRCSVTDRYDTGIVRIIGAMIKAIPVRGSINIQSIATSDGQIIPFEVNARISGTNSIRSHFGFDDVLYTLEEYLYGRRPSAVRVRKGSAIRVIMDVIYPGVELSHISDSTDEHFIF